jgi:hypothetical protein
MPAKRKLTMRHLRQLLRLDHEGVSAREIGRTLGAARSTIQDGLKRAKAAGLVWPLSSDLTDEVLEKQLFGRAGRKASITIFRTGLGGDSSRVEAAWRQSHGAMGGVPGSRTGWVPVFEILRSLSRVRAASFAGDAPTSYGRRQGLRRLLRQEDRDC